MNRRNFILGLGTAATLSGAASVTGAALSNTVDSTANFQVVATEELTIRRNNDLDAGGGNLATNGNYSDTVVDDFNHTEAFELGSTPNMTVNDTADGDLGMALAIENSNATAANQNATNGGTLPYVGNGQNTTDVGTGGRGVAPLEIVNNGGSEIDVGVEYEVGSDVDSPGTGLYNSDGDMDPGHVAELFTFEIDDTQISPDPSNANFNDPEITNEGNTASVPAGATVEIDFVLNMSDDLENRIQNSGSGGSYNINTDAANAVDLLNVARFGDNE